VTRWTSEEPSCAKRQCEICRANLLSNGIREAKAIIDLRAAYYEASWRLERSAPMLLPDHIYIIICIMRISSCIEA
jgi:hypothetical protein